MKIDAIPGRLNQDWFRADREGVFYGQCSELCGKDHAFMPIEVHVVSQAAFDEWAKTAQTAGLEEAYKKLAAAQSAADQLALK
jgi:cytochrome c oxidase subunit 2